MPTSNASGLSPRTLREYAAVLEVGVVNGALNAERVATWSASRRSVLRSAMKWKGLTGISVPPAPRRRRVALPVPTDVELERVQRAAEQLPRGVRTLVLLPLFLGLRAQEALGLERKAVARAVDVGELRLVRKGGHEDKLPVTHVAGLLAELLETPARAGGRWKRAGEVLSPKGGPQTQYMRLWDLVHRVGRRAGVPGLRPHLLRHAFATRMVEDGAPLPVVQRWLGHADMKTTFRYLAASPKSMRSYVRTPQGLGADQPRGLNVADPSTLPEAT